MMNAGRRRGSEKGKENDSAGAGGNYSVEDGVGWRAGRDIRVVRDEKFEAM
jgi:hypothetical protein